MKIITKENTIKLKLEIDKNLELKKCLVDELGISNHNIVIMLLIMIFRNGITRSK